MALPRITVEQQRALAALLDQLAAALDTREVDELGHSEVRGYIGSSLEGLAEELRGDDGRRPDAFYWRGRAERLPGYVSEVAKRHPRERQDQEAAADA